MYQIKKVVEYCRSEDFPGPVAQISQGDAGNNGQEAKQRIADHHVGDGEENRCNDDFFPGGSLYHFVEKTPEKKLLWQGNDDEGGKPELQGRSFRKEVYLLR